MFDNDHLFVESTGEGREREARKRTERNQNERKRIGACQTGQETLLFKER